MFGPKMAGTSFDMIDQESSDLISGIYWTVHNVTTWLLVIFWTLSPDVFIIFPLS